MSVKSLGAKESSKFCAPSFVPAATVFESYICIESCIIQTEKTEVEKMLPAIKNK